MKEKKVRRNKPSYTKTEKVAALKILERNDFNFAMTTRDTTIPKMTLSRWNKQLGPEVFDKSGLVRSISRDMDKKLDDEEDKLISLVFDAKKKALERIIELIPKEKDMNKLSNVLKALEPNKGTGGEQPPVAGATNIFNQIAAKCNTLILSDGDSN